MSLTELGPRSTNHRSQATNLAPNLARAIVVVVFGLYILVAFLRIFYQGWPATRNYSRVCTRFRCCGCSSMFSVARGPGRTAHPLHRPAVPGRARLASDCLQPRVARPDRVPGGKRTAWCCPLASLGRLRFVVASIAVNQARLTDSLMEIPTPPSRPPSLALWCTA